MPRFEGNPHIGGLSVYHDVVRAFTMIAPTLRMVVVFAEAHLDPQTGNFTVRTGSFSVVANRSKLEDIYYFTPWINPTGNKEEDLIDVFVPKEDWPDHSSPDHDHLIRAGWVYSHQIFEDEFLTITDYGHLIEADHQFRERGVSHEIVVCTWSPEFDQEYLVDAIARVSESARKDAKPKPDGDQEFAIGPLVH